MPLMLLFFFRMFFGYAKPVPINPYNFKNQRSGMIWVSTAGVGVNFLIAIILGLVVRFAPSLTITPLLSLIVLVNIWLGLFNLLPFPPLDGSKLLMALVDYRGGGRLADILRVANTPFGILAAIFIAMTFLPAVSNFLFKLITG